MFVLFNESYIFLLFLFESDINYSLQLFLWLDWSDKRLIKSLIYGMSFHVLKLGISWPC